MPCSARLPSQDHGRLLESFFGNMMMKGKDKIAYSRLLDDFTRSAAQKSH
jgi:hypothetical protein